MAEGTFFGKMTPRVNIQTLRQSKTCNTIREMQ